MPPLPELKQVVPDPLVDYFTELFTEARFDEVQPDGTLYCSDSNATLDPHEVAKHVRTLLGWKPYSLDADREIVDCYVNQIVPPKLGGPRNVCGVTHQGIVVFRFETIGADPTQYFLVPYPEAL